MRKRFAILFALTTGLALNPALAEMSFLPDGAPGTSSGPELQCVPYAREVSGVQIYGDAHSWWDKAEGRYARGHSPRVGAVMAFEPYRNMRLGHVAAVSRVIDSRTVLLRHANWSEINGRRGQIEDNVRAVDVSPANDWSQVRVWYAPIEALGTTAWPVHGFIYNSRASAERPAPPRQPEPAPRPSRRSSPNSDFAAQMALDRLPADDSFEAGFAYLK